MINMIGVNVIMTPKYFNALSMTIMFRYHNTGNNHTSKIHGQNVHFTGIWPKTGHKSHRNGDLPLQSPSRRKRGLFFVNPGNAGGRSCRNMSFLCNRLPSFFRHSPKI
jgi:hypothetical protein